MRRRVRMINRWALAAGLWATAAAAGAVGVGDQAPDFVLPGQVDPVHLSAQRGKFVYLDFWASWCAPCRQSFPWMNSLQQRWAAKGLQVIAIDVDTHRDDARRFLAEMSPAFVVAFDARGETPQRYAIQGMPTSMLIDPEGKVVYVQSGFHADEQAALEARLGEALAQRPHRATP